MAARVTGVFCCFRHSSETLTVLSWWVTLVEAMVGWLKFWSESYCQIATQLNCSHEQYANSALAESSSFCKTFFTVDKTLSTSPLLWAYFGLLVTCGHVWPLFANTSESYWVSFSQVRIFGAPCQANTDFIVIGIRNWLANRTCTNHVLLRLRPRPHECVFKESISSTRSFTDRFTRPHENDKSDWKHFQPSTAHVLEDVI